MSREIIARRFAQAAFEIAREKGRLDEWQADIEKVASLEQDAVIAAYFENPGVPFEDKTRLLKEKLGDVDTFVLNLIYLLLSRGRFNALPDIAAEYQKLVDEHRGIERAEVTSAVPLNDEDRQRIGQHLSDIIGKQVVLAAEKIDPSLIGGIIVRVAGKLLDGSTRSKLDTLKKEIARK